jgi:hypothetical protein
MASPEAFFFDMVECADEQIANVVVGDRVVDVLAAPLFGEEPRAVKLLEALRDGGDFLVELLRERGHAVLLVEQALDELQPLWRAECLKQLGGVSAGAR